MSDFFTFENSQQTRIDNLEIKSNELVADTTNPGYLQQLKDKPVEPTGEIVAPTIIVDNFIPNEDLSQEYELLYTNMLAELKPEFDLKLNEYLDNFFPKFKLCLPKADDWLCNMLENGGTGLPDNVENAIWQRAREREFEEYNRERETIINDFANRGFTLPSGMLLAEIDMATAKYQNKISQVNRDVMIKQAELYLENIKFAVETAERMRIQIIETALRYVNEYVNMYDVANKRAQVQSTTKQELWRASSEYYKTVASVEQIIANIKKANLDFNLDKYKTKMDYFRSFDTAAVNGVSNATGGSLQAVAAAMNSLNGLVANVVSA